MTARRQERPLGRGGRNRREQRKRTLIYCEGRNTERIYLLGLRRELRDRPVELVIGPEHSEPLSLVRAAAKHAREVAADPDRRFDDVWCVFDVEAPEPHPMLPEALREAACARIDCAISNPCFEFWLMLHFRALSRYLSSADAQRELAAVLSGYDKNGGKAFDYELVREGRVNASSRASSLHARHDGVGERCTGNPCTTMYRLLAALGL